LIEEKKRKKNSFKKNSFEVMTPSDHYGLVSEFIYVNNEKEHSILDEKTNEN